MANIGNITLSSLELEATGYVEQPDYLNLSMCLSNFAVSQYCRYNFNSLCGKLAAGEDGIFTLDDAENDAGVTIDSVVELPLTDFGISHQKRLRSIYVGYETEGSLKLTVTNDEGNEREYTLSALKIGNLQHGGKVSVDRDEKGRYWKLKIENIGGCDFSLDMIEVIPVILGRKPSGS